jgi:hypothetical protein
MNTAFIKRVVWYNKYVQQTWYEKVRETLKRQAPHPREMMIMVLILMFLLGKLVMLYIDQRTSVMSYDEDIYYYDEYFEVDEFLYE